MPVLNLIRQLWGLIAFKHGFKVSEKLTASLIVFKATVLKGLKTILFVVVVTSKHGDIRCCFVSL